MKPTLNTELELLGNMMLQREISSFMSSIDRDKKFVSRSNSYIEYFN